MFYDNQYKNKQNETACIIYGIYCTWGMSRKYTGQHDTRVFERGI